jgi:flagellar biosynthesis protein FlhF
VIEIINAFQILQPQAAILTKLDEAVNQGMAISALIERRLPLSYVTNGQQVPEDIYTPDAEALIRQCATSSEAEHDYNDNLNQDGWLAENYA